MEGKAKDLKDPKEPKDLKDSYAFQLKPGANTRAAYTAVASKMMAISKDQEKLNAQVIASSQELDNQLRTLRLQHDSLRAEAQAMRRCLDRMGVLPEKVLEAEIQRHTFTGGTGGNDGFYEKEHKHVEESSDIHQKKATPTRSRDATNAAAAAERAQRAVSRLVASTGAAGQQRQELQMKGGQQRQELQLKGGGRRESSPTITRRQATTRKSVGGNGTGHTPSNTSLLDCSTASTPPQNKSVRSPGKVDVQDRQEDAIDPSNDLYPAIQILLDRTRPIAEVQQANKTLQVKLKSTRTMLDSWSGPGTPLTCVVQANRPDLARSLLRARANPDTQDSKCVSPLHLATFEGNVDMMRLVLTAKANVDLSDCHGQTPLFFAPTREVCKMLIDRRADISVLNRKGQSALHLAGRAGLTEVLSWMSTRVSKALSELRDIHGATAKDYAEHVAAALQVSITPESLNAGDSGPASSPPEQGGGPNSSSRGGSPNQERSATVLSRRGQLSPPRLRRSGGSPRTPENASTQAGTSPQRTVNSSMSATMSWPQQDVKAAKELRSRNSANMRQASSDKPQIYEMFEEPQQYDMCNASDEERLRTRSPPNPLRPSVEVIYDTLGPHYFNTMDAKTQEMSLIGPMTNGAGHEELPSTSREVTAAAIEAAAAVATACVHTAAELDACQDTSQNHGLDEAAVQHMETIVLDQSNSVQHMETTKLHEENGQEVQAALSETWTTGAQELAHSEDLLHHAAVAEELSNIHARQEQAQAALPKEENGVETDSSVIVPTSELGQHMLHTTTLTTAEHEADVGSTACATTSGIVPTSELGENKLQTTTLPTAANEAAPLILGEDDECF